MRERLQRSNRAGRMRSCGGRWVLGVAVGLVLLSAPLAAAAARLIDVRVGVHPGYTRIVRAIQMASRAT